MIWSQSEQAWPERRARMISQDKAWPLPVALSEAAAQLVRSKLVGRAAVILPFHKRNDKAGQEASTPTSAQPLAQPVLKPSSASAESGALRG